MATASPWKDIDDKFCICAICLEQLKEPKLLPCLHRFCKDCLTQLLQASDTTLRCPECREEIKKPKNGIDGFKTDFYMKNLVDYVQIQQSLHSNETRECFSCLKYLRVAAYCLKCDNYLCADCYHDHMTNKALDDHKQHALSITDIKTKQITPEKLASMRDAPRCQVHPAKVSELFCQTCDNVPACVACMVGKHKGHELHEVTELARTKRQMLTKQLEALEKMKADRKALTPNKEKEKLIQNVTNKKEMLQKIYENKLGQEEEKLQEVKSRLKEVRERKKNDKEGMFHSLQRDMEREMQEVKNKYMDMYDKKKNEIDDEYYARDNFLEFQTVKSSERLEKIQKDMKLLVESIDNQQKEKVQNIEAIREHLEKENKQFENLNMVASDILASENDWIAAQFIPDLCTAATNLMRDLKKDFPELETLADIKIDYQQSSLGKASVNKIIDQDEGRVTINDTYYFFSGATSSGDGSTVITGCQQTGNTAFVIVVDLAGKVVKQREISATTGTPWHVCDFLSQDKVALACQPNTIGVFNVCDDSVYTRVVSEIVSSWPVDRDIKCVATDPVKKHILVGGFSSRDVYVFDDQLNYLQILTLPKIIKWPRDITVSDGHLLVCDYVGKTLYVTTMGSSETMVVREFLKPDLGINGLRPRSVCKDIDGFVYVLWGNPRLFKPKRYVVQYLFDGSQVLSTREVDRHAGVVTAVETIEGERLVVATYSTQTLYSYGLIEEK